MLSIVSGICIYIPILYLPGTVQWRPAAYLIRTYTWPVYTTEKRLRVTGSTSTNTSVYNIYYMYYIYIWETERDGDEEKIKFKKRSNADKSRAGLCVGSTAIHETKQK